MKKSIALLAAGVLALSAVFTGCTKDEELTKVRLNEVVHSVFYAPQYAAMELGFFEDEGLDIELSVGQGADKSMTALISDSADIALLGTEAGIYVYNEGRDDYCIAFTQLTQRAGNFLVSRTDEKNFKWENLKGKELIGGRNGGMPQMILEYILKNNGIDPEKDMTLTTNIAFTSTSGAFAGGVGDYTVEFEPSATALEEAGTGYVVASLGTESGFVPYTVYMATKNYISLHPDTVQKFTNAIYRGQLWVESHSAEEIAKVIQPHFSENSVETLTKIIERYKSQDTWKTTPVFEKESLEHMEDIMEGAGELDKRVDYNEFVSNVFAEEAIKNIK